MTVTPAGSQPSAQGPESNFIGAVSEAQRATMVERDFARVSPGVVKYTGEVLFQNL